MSTVDQVESRTQQLGREMLERLRSGRPWPWQSAWWQERMLRQCMADEWFKVQSFRFVDALPMMSSDTDIARHLQEYFVHPAMSTNGGGAHPAVEAPVKPGGMARMVSRWMGWRRPDTLRARFTSALARKMSHAMAGTFIAGTNIEEAVQTIRTMRRQKLAFTIDLLGEAALSPSEADGYYQTYLSLISELPRHAAHWQTIPQIDTSQGTTIPRVNVSVKVTSLHPGFDPIAPQAAKDRAKERLRPLLRKAMEADVHVQVDMEHYAIKDLTLELVRELFCEPEFRDYPHLGVVIQAYLKDGDRDTADMIAWSRRRGTPIWIRLVKGAYWDTETVVAEREHRRCPVWTEKWQSDACYERCAQALIENHDVIHTAFASHNVRSLAYAMALRDVHEVPGTAFELQMLYGTGDPIKRAAAEMGERCRVYTPYGALLPGMAYLIRRLLENTANESFLRQGTDQDTPIEKLLAKPGTPETRMAPAHAPPDPPEVPTRERFVNIADTDWSEAENRDAMTSALRAARARFDEGYPLIVDGDELTTGAWVESHNPANPKEIVGKVARADEAAIDRAVKVAVGAWPKWRGRGWKERAEYLFAAAEALERRRMEFAALAVLETGKSWKEASAEVSEAIDYLNFYAHEGPKLSRRDNTRDVPGERNEQAYDARGVVAVLSPWNFPLAMLSNAIAGALVTGNTIVAKPAHTAAVIAQRFVHLLHEVGLPRGVVNLLAGPGEEVGAAMVRHRDVAMVAFSGTRSAGLAVNRLAAEHANTRFGLKYVSLDLGASNAIIVDDDADQDEAIKGVVESAFSFAGQKCTSATRIVLLDGVFDRFANRFVETVKSLKPGPPEEPVNSFPPLIDAAAQEAVWALVSAGKQEAKCLFEGEVAPEHAESGGYYMPPIVFADVSPTSRLAQEEVFGPVVSLLRARDIDHAIELFNASDYGLVGGIFSRSPANIEKARRQCLCGTFYINRKITGSHVGLQPFGGVKASGHGATIGSPDYLLRFVVPRTITENTLRRGFAPSEQVAETLG